MSRRRLYDEVVQPILSAKFRGPHTLRHCSAEGRRFSLDDEMATGHDVKPRLMVLLAEEDGAALRSRGPGGAAPGCAGGLPHSPHRLRGPHHARSGRDD